jgi:hypothetical protein
MEDRRGCGMAIAVPRWYQSRPHGVAALGHEMDHTERVFHRDISAKRQRLHWRSLKSRFPAPSSTSIDPSTRGPSHVVHSDSA